MAATLHRSGKANTLIPGIDTSPEKVSPSTSQVLRRRFSHGALFERRKRVDRAASDRLFYEGMPTVVQTMNEASA